MNKLILLTSVVILSCGALSKAWAEDEIPTSGTCNDTGTCLWNLKSDGTMIISAAINPDTGQAYENVVMKSYECDDSSRIGNRPWEKSIRNIKNIVVDDNISNIGQDAFQFADNLNTVSGMKDVKNIEFDAFASTPLKMIETPNVEVIAPWALASTKLTSIDLPNIKEIYSFLGKNIEYVGLPDWNVKMPENAFANTKIPNCSNENRTACGSCGNDYVKRGVGCVSDCGTGYLGKDGRCIDASLGCGAGYRQFENFCNRIQYTPAEAAKVLTDDNNNSVTITFKK